MSLQLGYRKPAGTKLQADNRLLILRIAPVNPKCLGRIRLCAVPLEPGAIAGAKASVRPAYEKAVAPARQAYEETIGAARHVYKESTASAWRAYEQSTATARATYQEAQALAFLDASRTKKCLPVLAAPQADASKSVH